MQRRVEGELISAMPPESIPIAALIVILLLAAGKVPCTSSKACQGLPDASQLVHALHPRPLSRAEVDRREQHGDEDADDRNDNEKFDQWEAPPAPCRMEESPGCKRITHDLKIILTRGAEM